MAGVGSAFINILPNFGKFGSHMAKGIGTPVSQAGGAVEGLVAKIEAIPDSFGLAGKAADAFTHGALKNLSSLGHTMATKVAVGAETAFAGFGVKQAANLEQGLREVNTLFGLTGSASEKSFGKIKEDVRGLSTELGTAAITLTEGLYEALSSGVPRENAVEFMRVASKAAIGGVTETKVAVDGITTAVNAFGLNIADANVVADSFFATVIGGKTTFEELALNFADVAPVAAAAGITFQEVNASIATLTATGVRTAEATTQIRAAIQGLVKPSADMDAIFTKLGHTNAEAALRSEGLGYAITAVKDASGGSQGKLMELLGSIEAVSAAQIIAGEGADIFAKETQRQADAAGSSGRAYDEMEKSQASAFSRMKTAYTNFSIAIGEALGPAIRAITVVIEQLIAVFSAIPVPVQQVIAGLIFLATTLGPPIYMMTKLWGVLKLVRAGMVAMKTAETAAAMARLGGAAAEASAGVARAGAAIGGLAKGTLTYRAAVVATKAVQFGSFLAANATPIAAVSGLLIIGAGLFMKYRKEQAEATKRVKEFKEALDAETGALTEQNTLIIAKVITDKNLDKTAELVGVTVETLTRAMLGHKGAIDQVNEAVDRYTAGHKSTAGMNAEQAQAASDNFYATQRLKTEVNDSTNTVNKAEKGWRRDSDVKKEVAKVTGTASVATQELTENQVLSEEASKKMQTAIEGILSPLNVYKDTLDSLNDTASETAKKQSDSIKGTAKAAKEAVGERLKTEKKALEATHKAELDRLLGSPEAHAAVQRRHESEMAAFDERADAELAGAETTEESEGKRADALEKGSKRTVLTAGEMTAAVKKKIAETKKYFNNLATIALRGGGSIIGTLMDLGPAAADMVEGLATGSQPELDDFVKTVEGGSVDAVTKMREQFAAAPEAMRLIGAESGQAFADGLLEKLKSGKIDLSTILDIAGAYTHGRSPEVGRADALPYVPPSFAPGTRGGRDPDDPYFKGRARGGRFSPGEMIRVGERGEELVRFGSGGEVVPNSQLAGAGGGVTINNEVHARTDADAHEIAGELASQIAWRLRPTRTF